MLVKESVMEFSELIQNYCETIKDENTEIDTGGGFGNRDLWVKYAGGEYFISITDNKRTTPKETTN